MINAARVIRVSIPGATCPGLPACARQHRQDRRGRHESASVLEKVTMAPRNAQVGIQLPVGRLSETVWWEGSASLVATGGGVDSGLRKDSAT
jgi:hypothetical protein